MRNLVVIGTAVLMLGFTGVAAYADPPEDQVGAPNTGFGGPNPDKDWGRRHEYRHHHHYFMGDQGYYAPMEEGRSAYIAPDDEGYIVDNRGGNVDDPAFTDPYAPGYPNDIYGRGPKGR